MTVLIVDDQPDVVRGEEQGIDWPKLGIDTILTAYSVPEAEELLLSKRVDVLLCDIEMPPRSGLELLEKIREKKLRTRCIFLSAHAEFTYAQEAIRLGGFDYILQPAPYRDIERAILRALDDIKEKDVPTEEPPRPGILRQRLHRFLQPRFQRHRIHPPESGPGHLPGGDCRRRLPESGIPFPPVQKGDRRFLKRIHHQRKDRTGQIHAGGHRHPGEPHRPQNRLRKLFLFFSGLPPPHRLLSLGIPPAKGKARLPPIKTPRPLRRLRRTRSGVFFIKVSSYKIVGLPSEKNDRNDPPPN